MDFSQALKLLKMGNKVRNMSWKEGHWLQIEDGKIIHYTFDGFASREYDGQDILKENWWIVI